MKASCEVDMKIINRICEAIHPITTELGPYRVFTELDKWMSEGAVAKEERERCAKIAEQRGAAWGRAFLNRPNGDRVAYEIAELIRAEPVVS